MRHLLTIAFSLLALMLDPSASSAGLYHPDFLARFDEDQQGNPIPDTIDELFNKIAKIKSLDDLNTQEARDYKRAIQRRDREMAGAPPIDRLTLAADMLRLTKDGEMANRAIEILNPLSRVPPRGLSFLPRVQIAYAYMARGDFPNAAANQAIAIEELGAEQPFPPKFVGLTDAQKQWYFRLERDYLRPYLQVWARTPKASVPELAFPQHTKGLNNPVHFVGESGEFEVGTIAEAERAKLPKDAVAILQQLILWNPDDGWLWWLLAEVYNAEGNLEAARRIFDRCTREMKFTYPELLDHRRAVLSELDARERTEQERKDAETKRKRRREMAVWSGVLLVVLAVVYWQGREVYRRFKRRSKMTQQAQSVE